MAEVNETKSGSLSWNQQSLEAEKPTAATLSERVQTLFQQLPGYLSGMPRDALTRMIQRRQINGHASGHIQLWLRLGAEGPRRHPSKG